jgi:hypothetical protein
VLGAALAAPGDDELGATRALAQRLVTVDHVRAHLHKGGVLDLLAKTILPALQSLANEQPATGAELHNKFTADGTCFTFRYGDLSTYFGGLEAKIGAPTPRIHEAMVREHTSEADSQHEFVTGNYDVRTTPKIEWCFVASPATRSEWPTEGTLVGTAPEKMRRPLQLSELETRRTAFNARLFALGEPELMQEEVVAGRLCASTAERTWDLHEPQPCRLLPLN